MEDELTGPKGVVISNGSDMSKAGFAGEDAPRAAFPTAIVDYRTRGAFSRFVGRFIGDRAKRHYNARWPTKDGVITGNWDDMEAIWHHIFANELRCPSEESPLLLTEKAWNPVENRMKITETMFEKFNVPSLYLASESALTMYAQGRTTGLVVNMGEHSSSAIVVYEGLSVLHTLEKSPIGGKQIVEYMCKMIREKGYNLHNLKDKDGVRKILSSLGYTALDFDAEMENVAATEKEYKLPDGRIFKLDSERFRCAECLLFPNKFLEIECSVVLSEL